MIFIEPRVSRAANEWVAAQDRDVPRFRADAPGLVTVHGAWLRYSATSGETPAKDKI